MSYRRDFTIGLRETQDFYLTLAMGRWWKGIFGFGVVGALAGLLYTSQTALPLPFRAAVSVLTALVGAVISALVVAVSTRRKVKEQVSRSGRASYVQETEINGFGVHVSVGKDQAKMGFEDLVRVRETKKRFICLFRKAKPGFFPKNRWRTHRLNAPSSVGYSVR